MVLFWGFSEDHYFSSIQNNNISDFLEGLCNIPCQIVNSPPPLFKRHLVKSRHFAENGSSQTEWDSTRASPDCISVQTSILETADKTPFLLRSLVQTSNGGLHMYFCTRKSVSAAHLSTRVKWELRLKTKYTWKKVVVVVLSGTKRNQIKSKSRQQCV